MNLKSDKISPKILKLSWGSMEIEGLGHGKDFKLYPGGGKPWDWSETGTEHSPGIKPEDIEDLIEKNCEVIVLSTGMYSRLGVTESAKKLLDKKNIEYHILDTEKAVKLYNELVDKNKRIGGLFHSTC